ncbi:MAG: ATP-binding cassette domain-containing protein [Patescibacteria group bacterium]
MQTIIHIKNLVKEFEVVKKQKGLAASFLSLFKREKIFVKAIKDISFDIKEGELVGFLGPNGAGKTTTLKILSGIVYPTSGEVTTLGYIPSERKEKFQKQFALVMGQKNQLPRAMPAMDGFLLIKAIYEIPDAEFNATLEELTELLDITSFLDIPVRKLSLGQRMKCELVAALLHGPKVLLLDEPTIGLDVTAQKNIREFIKKYNREKKTTIILTSHYMDDIKELCERVIIINHGEVVYDGKLALLMEKYAPHKTISITTSISLHIEKLKSYGELIQNEEFAAVFKVARADAKHLAARLIESDLGVEDILIHEASIDDVVRHIFSQKSEAKI